MASLGRWEFREENPTPNENRPTKDRNSDCQAIRIYESLIVAEADYPLKHWIDYLKWSESNQEPDAQFLLMERCVRTCMNQCKDDVRFIQICVRYADKTSFPPDVFKYLYQHEVGIKVALFWIAWAWVAETIGDFAFCEKIYKRGILKEAAPLALLRQRQKQFQRRMTRHRLNSLKQQSELKPNKQGTENKREQRKPIVYGDTSGKSASPKNRKDDFVCDQRGESRQLRKRALPNPNDAALPCPSIKQHSTEIESNCKTPALINCGFKKELVARDAEGQESCFEEYRARGRHFNLLQNQNVNNFAVEESVEEVDMETDESTSVSKESIPARRVLFSTNSSVDEHDHRCLVLNSSTASSTVSRFVGESLSREEETINTKFAMKELSMMFSSPAMGLADGHNCDQPKRHRLNDSTSFDGPLMEEDDRDHVNNSIVNPDSLGSEKKQQFEIFSDTDGNGVQTISVGDDDRQKGFSIYTDDARDSYLLEEKGHHNSNATNDELREAETSREVQIFIDENEGLVNQRHTANEGLESHTSMDDASVPLKRKGFQIFTDENEKPDVCSSIAAGERKAFVIFSDKCEVSDPRNVAIGNRPQKRSKDVLKDVSIFHEGEEIDTDSVIDGDGDTATLSLFSDLVGAANDVIHVNEAVGSGPHSGVTDSPHSFVIVERKPIQMFDDAEDGDSESTPDAGEGGDTATFSVFGDAVEALTEMTAAKPSRPSDLSPLGDDKSVHNLSMDDFRKFKPPDSGSILIDGAAFGDISMIDADVTRVRLSPNPSEIESSRTNAYADYTTLHKDDVRLSLRQLSNDARPIVDRTPFADPETDLVVMLSRKGSIVELTNQSLPRGLRRKTSTQGEEIKVGSRTGIVKQELGRGSYGVVVLLDSDREGTIAVKAQAPTDCLAWEYIVMKRLEERCQIDPFPFPRPLSFVSLADGAMLGMTAGSQNGMNLVDISNVYKVQEGCQVPELVALHYTAKMLKHIETLHWHGKVLHCDVKPDNWVLVASSCAYEGCSDVVECADLMLVDFGRAIDLTSRTHEGVDPLDVKLRGEASDPGMACAAMRMNLGWSFDADSFGICASAHVLLYGSHMEIELDRSKRWKIRKQLRRYWQKDVWADFFDSLLNDAIASRPGSLRQRREKIEDYLKTKSKDLEYLLKHQARILPKKRLD